MYEISLKYTILIKADRLAGWLIGQIRRLRVAQAAPETVPHMDLCQDQPP